MEYSWDTALASDNFRTELPRHIGYKVLNIGRKGENGISYEVGVIYEFNEPLKLCEKTHGSDFTHHCGFNYCEFPIWLNNFYNEWLYGIEYVGMSDNYEYWMVEILGDSLHYNDNDHISITSKFRLIRQINKDWSESFDGVEDGILHTLSGDTYHIKNHMLHSEDGPAMILANGYKAWYLNNKIYRDIEDGYESWWLQDKSGHKLLHRSDDLPARIDPNGDRYWYKNGKRHRLNDNPAVIKINNTDFRNLINERLRHESTHFYDIPGIMEWWVDGKMQRSGDKPAKITAYGDMIWYQMCLIPEEPNYIKLESMLHRDEEPAIIRSNGEKLWFVNGKFIRRTPKFGYKKVINGSFIDPDCVWNEKEKFEIDVVYKYQNEKKYLGVYGYQILETPFDLILDSLDSIDIYGDMFELNESGVNDSSKLDIGYVKIEILGDIEYHEENSYTDKFKVIQTITKQEILDSLVDAMYTINNDNIFYIKDKKFHRTDGPAVIIRARVFDYSQDNRKKNKIEMWFVNGVLHSTDDLPAIQYSSDSYVWENSKKNNIAGQWWIDGKRHRSNDLPAVVFGDKHREWWVDGHRHRSDDKPAIIKGIINTDGFYPVKQEWWYNGKQHRNFDNPAIVKYCNKFISVRTWIINGMIHRTEDKPAIIYTNHNGLTVCEEWYEDNILHRADDKPAKITNNFQKDTIFWTEKEWFDHGLIHRSDDKPARIKHSVQKEQIIVMSEEWYVHGIRHRDNDLPAINRSNGHKEWYEHGKKIPNPKYKSRRTKNAKKPEQYLIEFLNNTNPDTNPDTKFDPESFIQDGLRQRY
jgi:hypothetical protein